VQVSKLLVGVSLSRRIAARATTPPRKIIVDLKINILHMEL
jgi:hypothetical protein